MFVQIVSYNSKRVSVSPGKVIKIATLQFHNYVFITTVISHPEVDEILTHGASVINITQVFIIVLKQ